MPIRPSPLALAAACTFVLLAIQPACAADPANLVIYRSDSPALYASHADGELDAGYAIVREQRSLELAAGIHDLFIGDLPRALDAEALALSFPGNEAKVLAQRLLLAQGPAAALTGMLGREVTVLGSGGQTIAKGPLLRAVDGLLIGDAAGATLVRDYAAVRATQGGFPSGSSLSVRLDAARAGAANAVLSYPSPGLGWRAAYVATLQPGSACSMQFESRASIANRSGRDWHDARVTLIAGEPNMAKDSAPRPMMAMARSFSAKADSAQLPQQDSIGDYRSFTLPAPVDLPDGSVSQVPLYAARTMTCERTALYENGNSYRPPQPMLASDFNSGDGGSTISSTLKLTAFDSLPAGYLRVLTQDRQGVAQFIGEGRINDTPKGSDASITLGTAFDLRAERTRTSFKVDKTARAMDEAFRIELSNAGDSPRTVTVREHPNRWQQWSLVSSSSKPSQQSPDLLEFRVEVPAQGKAVLTYAVRYQWGADQQPQ